MITKFLPKNARGASAEYSLGLLTQETDPREPEILIGNSTAFLAFHARFNPFTDPYSSAVISLREKIEDPMAKTLASSFVDNVLPGSKPGQFAVLAVRHKERSPDFDHRTAVHFHFSHTNLLLAKTKRVQPNWAPTDNRRNQTWTEIQNLIHGLTSPADPVTQWRIGIKTWPNTPDARATIGTLTDELLGAVQRGADGDEISSMIKRRPAKEISTKTYKDGVIVCKFALEGVRSEIRLMPPAFSRVKEFSRIKDLVNPRTGLLRTTEQLRTLWDSYENDYMAAAKRFHKKHDTSLTIARVNLDRTRSEVEEIIRVGLPAPLMPQLIHSEKAPDESSWGMHLISPPKVPDALSPSTSHQPQAEQYSESSMTIPTLSPPNYPTNNELTGVRTSKGKVAVGENNITHNEAKKLDDRSPDDPEHDEVHSTRLLRAGGMRKPDTQTNDRISKQGPSQIGWWRKVWKKID